ncbi:MAG: CYTH and CHAD domain-containing protein [Burkholderiales bacterium]|nr:MAG: CYTH and CHAD domain-containing protein [Burkholderiales bacterium]
MPESTVEFELKFLVPRGGRSAVRAALGERGATLETRHLVARYFDTADRRLARAGMSLRLRREGRRWMQTLKAGREGSLARFEHEVLRPDATVDAAAHAGTSAGDRLAQLLADGEPLQQRYGSDIRRTLRRLRTRGTAVELAFDEGRIDADHRVLRVCELEFELLSGSPAAMLALAERWRARLGLVVDPRSKAERGDALADGRSPAAPRKAMPVALRRKVDVADAWRAVLDECLAQILGNAVGLAVPVGVESVAASGRHAGRGVAEPAPTPAVDRADLVHQLRIGLRRLRSALRLFRGWVAPPPEAIEAGARELFRALGATRDQDVLAQAIEPALRRAGAPAQREPASTPAGEMPAAAEAPTPATAPMPAAAPTSAATSSTPPRSAASRQSDDLLALITADPTQRYLLALVDWRSGLDVEPPTPGAGVEAGAPASAPPPVAVLAKRRLARWQRAIGDQASRFAQLDDASRHALRKRAKRLRYAGEFVESLFPGREMRRFLRRLQAVQQALGELSDLALAAQRYGQAAGTDRRAWFALGWVSARRDAVVAQAAEALAALAERHPFGGKR